MKQQMRKHLGTTKVIILTSLLFLFIQAGCSSNELLGTNGNGKEVTITAGIDATVSSRISYAENNNTTPSLTVNWEATDQLSVYSAAGNGGTFSVSSLNSDAHQATFKGSFPTEPATGATIYAYAARKNVTTDGTTVTTDLSNQDGTIAGAAAHDVLFATGTYDPTSTSPVTLNFSHKMSFLKLVLNFPATETTTTISNITLRGIGLYKSVSLNASDASLASSTVGNISISPTTINSSHQATVYACLYPGTISNVTAYATVGSKIYTFNVQGTTDKVLAAQKLYTVTRTGTLGDMATSWYNFILQNANNVLLDYSYAGYNHGESAPPVATSLGYKIYNVKDYGAIPNDGLTDRAALEAIVTAIGKGKANANAIIYFPEGEYILHTAADDVNGVSQRLDLIMGHMIIRGDGRDKTFLVMDAPNQPADATEMWSSPVMLSIRNNGGNKWLDEITSVSGDAAKGSFSVDVASTATLSANDWVCLKLVNNDASLIKQEIGRDPESTMTNLTGTGVQVYEYHQIKSISGNTLTFYEPIMHAVEAKWNWFICTYSHYEGVGVEDLTFVGHAKSDFVHHASWQDDGAYKPINFTRMTNSWMRRVGFKDVSEAFTTQLSANVSVYDITITGNRGHSSIRSEGSTRVFIGGVKDNTNGLLADDHSQYVNGTGQYHACGVSKQSIGTVIYNATWGSDGCFEAHATQPRATLIDASTGGFMQYRMGGDRNQLPNHLDDLTLWNFNATNTSAGTTFPFQWWSTADIWIKTMPPTVVGFHGYSIQFPESQMKLNESQGTAVKPASLYEAQLKERLGFVPAWLGECK